MTDIDLSLNVIKCFTFYIYNKWNIDEAYKLFGPSLGAHIHMKSDSTPDKLSWFANLDTKCKRIIINRALEIYDT